MGGGRGKSIVRLTEGVIQKGGVNHPPKDPRPNVTVAGQRPAGPASGTAVGSSSPTQGNGSGSSGNTAASCDQSDE